MPLRFLRISKRLIGGEVVHDAVLLDAVFAHDVHGVYNDSYTILRLK